MMGFNKHQHQWTEVKRVYNPGADNFESSRMSSDLVKRMVWGMTIIELRCDECGKLDHYSVIGECR